MEQQILLDESLAERKKLLLTKQFFILSILTFNIYTVWWIYKAWKIFEEKGNLDINPALRTIFSIIYLYSLLEKINHYAAASGYKRNYNSVLLYIILLISGLSAYLPEPLFLVSLIGIVIYLLPFNALNFALRHSSDFETTVRSSFSTRQIVLLVIGGIVWFLMLIGLFLG